MMISARISPTVSTVVVTVTCVILTKCDVFCLRINKEKSQVTEEVSRYFFSATIGKA